MSQAPSIPAQATLWKQISAERRQQAAEAFWRSDDAAEQAEVIGLIAQRLKFRRKSVVALPIARKSQYLLGLPALPEMLVSRLLIAYHLAHQRPLMGAFLDALGVPHNNGLIEEKTDMSPDAATVRAAVQSIAAAFPPEDVALYLSTLYWQNPETWTVLAELPETSLSMRRSGQATIT